MSQPRPLKEARINACRIRRELPRLVQPSQSDYDIVTLLEALEAKERHDAAERDSSKDTK